MDAWDATLPVGERMASWPVGRTVGQLGGGLGMGGKVFLVPGRGRSRGVGIPPDVKSLFLGMGCNHLFVFSLEN